MKPGEQSRDWLDIYMEDGVAVAITHYLIRKASSWKRFRNESIYIYIVGGRQLLWVEALWGRKIGALFTAPIASATILSPCYGWVVGGGGGVLLTDNKSVFEIPGPTQSNKRRASRDERGCYLIRGGEHCYSSRATI